MASPTRSGWTIIVLCSLLFVFAGTVSADISQEQREKTYRQLEIFSNVLSILQENYVEEIDTQKAVGGAIQGLLLTLDPHSSYLKPEELKDLQEETSGSFSGIGIEITIKDGILTVVSPIEGTPADKAGVKANDLIVEIDGRKTKDMTSDEAIKRLRGTRGSKVTITIQREGENQLRPLALVRDVIPIHSVKASFLTPGFAYFRITNFQSHTTRDFKRELINLHKQQTIRGLILDLRNNPGGLLNQAVSISDIFLQKGTIVSTKGRTEDQNMVFQAHSTADDAGMPIVVLINEGSASASEIVAGAIQDHKRGVIVGARSFGKGSVQTIIPLPDGSGLRMTTARYYTPANRSIQALGINPDVEVSAQEPATENEAAGGETLRETEFDNHIDDRKKPTPPTMAIDPELKEKLKNDPQLNTALNILKSLDLFSSYRQLQARR
ncbi:S41 family peptidase [Desulfoprunum benzoelyticum]|uniref:Carboxyl-terminal processing protease n=1 Tax=Desulfoprunum benzoelyticum TaxID=1506996 RepID=A0A840V0H9_9BACT|nr:S41 family peptidase [Desulfoprunum benzoelyticum]MBB5346721.1 carboxyl-terminal processing protease [Desulfoprunum benzoelyticum]MBM9529037.1 S41 family peptidase [Desulfoprunum benzoelyticum]